MSGVDRWLPSDVDGDERAICVVSLQFAGGVIRMSDAQATISSDEGDLDVFGGLVSAQWDTELAIPLGEGTESEPFGVEVEIQFPPEFDVAQLVEDGHALDGTPVEVAVLHEGEAWEDRRVILAGRVLDPRYGRLGESVSFSADAGTVETGALVPPADRVVQARTWPGAIEDAEGTSYPVVFGRPGDVAGAKLAGSTATVVDEITRRILLSDGWVTATTVWLHDDDEKGSGWSSVVVDLTFDNQGNKVSTCVLPTPDYAKAFIEIVLGTGGVLSWAAGDTITIGTETLTAVVGARTPGANDFSIDSGTANGIATEIDDAIDDAANTLDSVVTSIRNNCRLTLTSAVAGSDGEWEISHVTNDPGVMWRAPFTGGSDIWATDHTISVSWGAASAGLGGVALERSPGGTVTTAGELLEWLLIRSGRKIDAGKIRAAVPLLSGVEVSTAIEKTTDPVVWIRAHLLPILPVALESGPGGIYPLVYRWWAGLQDSIGDLDLDRDGGELVGRVELTGEIASEIDIAFARDLKQDRYVRRALLTGDPVLIGTGNTILSNVYVRAAWARRQRAAESVTQTGAAGSGRVSLALESDVLYDRASAQRVATWLSMARWTRHRKLTALFPRTIAGWMVPGEIVTFTSADLRVTSKQAIIRGMGDPRDPVVPVALTVIEQPRKTSD